LLSGRLAYLLHVLDLPSRPLGVVSLSGAQTAGCLSEMHVPLLSIFFFLLSCVTSWRREDTGGLPMKLWREGGGVGSGGLSFLSFSSFFCLLVCLF